MRIPQTNCCGFYEKPNWAAWWKLEVFTAVRQRTSPHLKAAKIEWRDSSEMSAATDVSDVGKMASSSNEENAEFSKVFDKEKTKILTA